ncbi:MAG: helix-turn-helix transcriptional regulator [Alphaproteobacteria bacterium]|nr:helix-turn-helix transcriptional regulator [Alphaproteobacteria bacterium]MCB9794357.1 helix-turn-helix transcriptional regulator [Alphaproteobacteria bacterium]
MPHPPDKELRRLWRGAGLSVGRYDCAQCNRAPGPEQPAAHHVLNFAAGGLYLKHLEGRDWVIDRNCVMFTNAGEVFRTSHPAGSGDHGLWLSLSGATLAELAPSVDPALVDRGEAPFQRPTRPMSPEIYLRARRLAAELSGAERAGGGLEGLEAEERLLELAALCLATPEPPPLPGGHRRLARDLQALLAQRYAERLSLGALAASLDTSRFHLARVFKAATGWTVHAYREQLRLREALERLRDPSLELSELALSLGFSSHSHFSDRFRRGFGCAPSEARARI